MRHNIWIVLRSVFYVNLLQGFPDGGSAYFITSDGHRQNITVENNAADISENSNVTVIITYQNGTKYCSKMLPGNYM